MDQSVYGKQTKRVIRQFTVRPQQFHWTLFQISSEETFLFHHSQRKLQWKSRTKVWIRTFKALLLYPEAFSCQSCGENGFCNTPAATLSFCCAIYMYL